MREDLEKMTWNTDVYNQIQENASAFYIIIAVAVICLILALLIKYFNRKNERRFRKMCLEI